MGRKILLEGMTSQLLEETTAEDEKQLQELLKKRPDLLPIEDFELTGPLMIVGRETTLASGSVDLVGLARGGDILIIEFKTGPQNPDFRHAAAQLLDYGSHLWTMSFDDFEKGVALRYFSSDRCPQHSPTWKKKSLRDAAEAQWPGISDQDWASMRSRVETQLKSGAFVYILATQQFRESMERTLTYLNEAMPASRFFAVELVRFQGDGQTAFEARTIVRPQVTRGSGVQAAAIYEESFLDSLDDASYKAAVEQLFGTCHALGLRFEWGSKGTSIRLPTPDRAEPLSIGWIFPPGVTGWMGLTDLTLGFDTSSAQSTPSVAGALADYVAKVATIFGANPAKAQNINGHTLDPPVVTANLKEILEAITALVESVATVS